MGHNSPEALHALVEAKRIAFADRAAYDGDPASVPASVLKTLISKDYAALRRKEIDPQHAAESYKAGVMPGVPPTAAIADITAFSVSWRTDRVLLMTCDTVVIETPLTFAMSAIVADRRLPLGVISTS
jgi:gamma-glutamyltranspeptidase